jgi:hypothetical protein
MFISEEKTSSFQKKKDITMEKIKNDNLFDGKEVVQESDVDSPDCGKLKIDSVILDAYNGI